MRKIVIVLICVFSLYSCSDNKSSPGNENLGEKTQKTILTLGDSLTAGYNLDFSDAYPYQLETVLNKNGYNYKVINAGVSADTSKNLLDRIGLYDDIDVDIYLIGIGANDGLRKQSIDTMKENISKIISHVRTVHPNSKIVIQGMQIPLNLGLGYSRDFKNAYKEVSKENKTFLFEFLLQDVALNKSLNLSDAMHPNREGYNIIAHNIYNFLEDNNIILK